MSSSQANEVRAEPAGPSDSMPLDKEMKDRKGPPGADDPFSNFEHAPKPAGDPWEILLKPELEADTERCNAWKDEVQNLLIFAGLFSAVVTAFVVESYKFLQPDPNDTIIGLLFHIANGSAPFPPSITSASMATPFSQTSSSIRINVFWFISLILSLTTVLIGTISIQWLREHQSYPNFSAKEKLAILHMRRESLEVWLVPQIFAALPVLLQIALALFLAGLIDFVLPLGRKLSIPVFVIVGFILFFLIVTTALPICQGFLFLTGIYPYKKPPTPCAFKSPQSYAILVVFSPLLRLLSYLISRTYRPISYHPTLLVRRYNALPALKKAFRQKAWPAFDRQWLFLRDVCHQCILDRDQDLYYHQEDWRDSFPLSDVTQCLVRVAREPRYAAKHTESFLGALVLCFQEISASIWTAPCDSFDYFQRKDRRHNYFKQFYVPHSPRRCSLSEYLLHGGVYNYKNYIDLNELNQHLMSTSTLHLFCQDEVLTFLKNLIPRHTSFTLAQYQLELWTHMMSSKHKRTALTPPTNDATRMEAITSLAGRLLVSYESPSVNVANATSTIFKLAASQCIQVSVLARDRTVTSLWLHPDIGDTTSSLGFAVGSQLRRLNSSSRQDVIALYNPTFKLIASHLEIEMSKSSFSSEEDIPSLFFYVSSLFAWTVLDWLMVYEDQRVFQHEILTDTDLRSVLDALQPYRTLAINKAQNDTFKPFFQDQDFSWSKRMIMARFSDEWWDLLSENATELFKVQVKVQEPSTPTEEAADDVGAVVAPSTFKLASIINHAPLEILLPPPNGDTIDTAVWRFKDEAGPSASFVSNSEDWVQGKKQQSVCDLSATANGAPAVNEVLGRISNSPPGFSLRFYGESDPDITSHDVSSLLPTTKRPRPLRRP